MARSYFRRNREASEFLDWLVKLTAAIRFKVLADQPLEDLGQNNLALALLESGLPWAGSGQPELADVKRDCP